MHYQYFRFPLSSLRELNYIIYLFTPAGETFLLPLWLSSPIPSLPPPLLLALWPPAWPLPLPLDDWGLGADMNHGSSWSILKLRKGISDYSHFELLGLVCHTVLCILMYQSSWSYTWIYLKLISMHLYKSSFFPSDKSQASDISKYILLLFILK